MKKLLWGLVVGTVVGAAVTGAVLGRPAAAQGSREKAAAVPPAPAERQPDDDLTVRITPEMVRYSNTRYALYFVGTLCNLLVLVLILRSGLSARIGEFAERKSNNGLVRAFIYCPLFLAAYSVLMLPLAFYSGFVLPHQYGVSTQSLGNWVLDSGKSFGLRALMGSPVVALLYWTLRTKPRSWWLGFWIATIPLLVLTTLLWPLLVDPLFNTYQPLRNIQLRDRILALAEKAGIERGRVFEVDASRRTKAVNAYVTGIGGSARIVLWDTLLQKLDEDEVLFVMGHEMGHYAERHVPLLLAGSIVGTLFFLIIIDRSARLLIARNGEAWKIDRLDQIASLPVLVLLTTVLNFLGSPVESAISRTFEQRADTFGLRLTGDGRTAARSFIKLSELNLSHPDPPLFIELWMFSHPPLKQRIEKALAWPRAGGAEHPL
jgi:STE24 endopeptidase